MTATLARLRVTLGFALGVVVLLLAQPTASSLAAGAVIALVGESLRVWAAGHLNKAREVTVSGPYRFSAHPLYLGSSIMGVGLAVIANHVIVSALIVTYLVATLMAAIKSEEAFLRGKFGDRYEKYRRAGDAPEADRRRRFSIAQAIANREQRTIAGLGVALLLLFLKATYNGLFWGVAAGR